MDLCIHESDFDEKETKKQVIAFDMIALRTSCDLHYFTVLRNRKKI